MMTSGKAGKITLQIITSSEIVSDAKFRKKPKIHKIKKSV